ncbi:hypothetical protein CMUS01_13508 [Colletotrichum musicola]|uniref:Ankyrin repeat protein n=1 Tax=Colletotrichum musicola TaxID=2175873 RepID=A0A8H6JBX5_9PEZI|nr:hypothetical protein CMUS01_13508 [Colletotrichum musicola]
MCRRTMPPTSNTDIQIHSKLPQLREPPTATTRLLVRHWHRRGTGSGIKNTKKPRPERLFRREVSTNACQQHQLDCGRKTQALRHMLSRSTNLFLRDSIGDKILHTLAGDFGLPNLSAETEGYDILRRLFDFGPDGFGLSVKSCCLSMIDWQNDGYSMTDRAPAEPFMHTPLGVAILYNNLACAELLLQHGANPNIPGEWGQRPLFFAHRNNSEGAVQLLIAYGARL